MERRQSVRSQLFGAPDLERCWGMPATCTLLGPEGSGPGNRDDLRASTFLSLLGECAGYRPYFENYTVDASILDSDSSGSGSQIS